ncbi:hypothetical protein PhCBS80983_g04391 [Powellomyces hirtus]|uniref:Uncharacterized protein n=1 Tax=Powellomyces hirtus TaxID=109895 RepID=A0A507DY03_9FUNG|nr:hypothetical protein PhCBS80983_g04391 [Powellomyces hirtus]
MPAVRPALCPLLSAATRAAPCRLLRSSGHSINSARWASSSEAKAVDDTAPSPAATPTQNRTAKPTDSATTIPTITSAAQPATSAPSETTPTPKPSSKASSFPLPSIFHRKSSLAAHVADYPWLLSTSPPRRPRPTFWSVLRDKHFLAVGTARARKHLNHPTYDFPDQFCDDAAAVTQQLFETLSDPQRAADEEALRPVLVKAVADRFAHGYRAMLAQGNRIEFVLKSKPKVTVTGTHFTYGPYPAPQGYIAQQWWSLIELIIPEEDGVFTSHPRQKEIMQRAMDDGVFFKVDVRVDCDLESIVTDERSGMPIIRDTRRQLDLQFISPHFTPWDEVFELDSQGEWKLRWQWRISDVDWIVESMMPKVDRKHKIDWRPRKDL